MAAGLTAHPAGRRRPRIIWLVLPLVVLVIGVVLLIVGISTLLGSHVLTEHPISPSGTVSIPADGVGVYERGDISSIPTCQAADPAGTRTILRRPAGTATISTNGVTYTLVATTPPNFPAGTYAISCDDGSTDLATGPNSFRKLAVGIVETVIGGLLTFFGIIGVIVAFIVRLLIGRRSTGVPAGYPAYGQPGQSSPGQGYPPPGQGAPGQGYPPPVQDYPAPGQGQPPKQPPGDR